MVKGVARRVVVVKAPESPLFEQAIFILRDDIEAQRGVDADAILREACNTAGEYVRKHTKKQAPFCAHSRARLCRRRRGDHRRRLADDHDPVK